MSRAVRGAVAAQFLSDVLPDVQGIVMRGYRLGEPTFARYFVLVVRDRTAAGTLVRSLVDGSVPDFQIRSSADWGPSTPATCLNIGFSFNGLASFGIPAATLSSPAWFGSPSHTPFMNGSAASAPTIGDVADSAPSNWIVDDRNFDVMLALWAKDLATLEAASVELRALLAAGFEIQQELTSQDLLHDMIYFGYRDGIAQPILSIDPYYKRPDGNQQPVDNGAFILGTATTTYFQNVNLPGGNKPPGIGLHGSFAAFRMLEQKVEEFEAFVEGQRDRIASLYGTSPAIAGDAMKALLVGRWPANGTPVAIDPVKGRQTLPPDLPSDEINDFLYTDKGGSDCPYSSHIRRNNPRNTTVEDLPSRHRIMRRAMPYQLPYDPNDRNTGERGLMGFFIGASLRDSFEFLMETWVNGGSSSGLPYPASRDPADPVIGHNLTTGPWTFTTVMPPPPPTMKTNVFTLSASPVPGFTNFVRTRGSAYVYLPGMQAISTIAGYATG
ncbi:MAG: hypothetical protein JO036_15680 [Candidatus Eremiobacteraeota bacterium]|nr:hypothetical protein [Candidatus Eremiobacteraeota bacterium]